MRLLPLALLLGSGCASFASPSELDRPQILAIIAAPPGIAPGEASQLSVVVAGPDGEVADLAVDWQVTALAGQVPLGTIDPAGPSVTYRAPAEVAALPTAGVIQTTVHVGGRDLVGLKGVVLGSTTLLNPSIARVEVAGAAADGATVAHGADVELGARLMPTATDAAELAWYTTAGKLDDFRAPRPVLTVRDDPGPAWLFLVARDHGGTAVARFAVTVE